MSSRTHPHIQTHINICTCMCAYRHTHTHAHTHTRTLVQEAGLTLFEIASIMTRPYEGGGEELSDLENFASYARTAIEVCALGCSGKLITVMRL